MEGFLALAGATLLSPFLAWLASRFIDKGKETAAFLELTRDPLYDPGSVLQCVRRGGTILIGRCEVHSLRVGRIEVRGIGENEGLAMSWSCREFIALDPIAEVRK